ncbi:actin cytoskeleton-regulatory complex protein PAN1-like isoform X1 [Carassius auratus]|uniref:Actin cytoskeleton-regulatory complex protein PAN1-like isoform X1 n=1 Tax=Carassius auratus TaxID=7957 RepID=A0A6P6N078_CARAU|nr:actin cytoskeleton-regulatory complex protein PAN1-like isoform X1 [Carassius auratus]
MGSNQFQSQNTIICVLCDQSDENKTTGTLSSKGNISAHQNCLLYASALYCKSSPTYDDLFGFDVEDVKKELRRGKRLICHYCKKKGATAGCGVKHCKRSYHLPCAIEDHASIDEKRFELFCELHDPESKKKSSPDGRRPNMKRPGRRDSDSSTGSSVSSSKKKKTIILLDSDDEDESMYAPVQSDIEDLTAPEQNNLSTPDPENKRPCAKPSPSTTGSLNLRSAQKDCGSADNSVELHGRSKGFPYMYRASMSRLLKVTPRRRKNKHNVDSDDESPASADRAAAPGLSDPEDPMLQKQPKQSTPVPKKTRLCEKLNPTTTEADDDTDIDSEESQSLLPSKTYHITVPCSVILDSGPFEESEHSLESSSPAGAAVSTSPGSVTETPPTNRTPPPRAPTTDPVPPAAVYSMPTLDYFPCDPSGQPGSPQHPRPTVDVPAVPPTGVSPSPRRLAAADASDVGSTVNSESSATKFWTRCNEAGWTKEIFSELVSRLSSLEEKVQSQKASRKEYDVAFKVLEASGQLPCIITHLEQDLEKEERYLQRRKAALRDAKAVLNV